MQREVVNIKDPSILSYIYPDYITLSYVSFLNRDDKVIYTGKPFKNFEDYLDKNTKTWISLVGNPTLDLTSNTSLIEFCYDLKGKTLNSSTLHFLEALTDKDLWYALKIFLQIGKLPYDVKKGVSIYSLFNSFSEPTPTTLKILFELVDSYPLPILESSLLTFLDRVSHNTSDNVSNKYGLLINTTRNKFGKNIKPSLLNYCKSEQSQLDFINLILNIRGV